MLIRPFEHKGFSWTIAQWTMIVLEVIELATAIFQWQAYESEDPRPQAFWRGRSGYEKPDWRMIAPP